jgi:hypothetical protein
MSRSAASWGRIQVISSKPLIAITARQGYQGHSYHRLAPWAGTPSIPLQQAEFISLAPFHGWYPQWTPLISCPNCFTANHVQGSTCSAPVDGANNGPEQRPFLPSWRCHARSHETLAVVGGRNEVTGRLRSPIQQHPSAIHIVQERRSLPEWTGTRSKRRRTYNRQGVQGVGRTASRQIPTVKLLKNIADTGLE